MFFRQPDKSQLTRIRFLLFLLALMPLARLIWLGATESLGANPIEFIERSTGTWALIMLLIALALTPIRLLTGIAWPVQLRRMAGLFMFFYACLHFTSYLWLDHWFDWSEISKHIIKHPYVLVGFLAFVLAVPLALTSSNTMMRRLGGRWKLLHRMVYPIAILAVLHFWWLVKKDIREPMFYALVLLLLLVIRVLYAGRKQLKTQTTSKIQAHNSSA
jgi:methionine sulfoxide reductase heme-binding subunit